MTSSDCAHPFNRYKAQLNMIKQLQFSSCLPKQSTWCWYHPRFSIVPFNMQDWEVNLIDFFCNHSSQQITEAYPQCFNNFLFFRCGNNFHQGDVAYKFFCNFSCESNNFSDWKSFHQDIAFSNLPDQSCYHDLVWFQTSRSGYCNGFSHLQDICILVTDECCMARSLFVFAEVRRN